MSLRRGVAFVSIDTIFISAGGKHEVTPTPGDSTDPAGNYYNRFCRSGPSQIPGRHFTTSFS